MNMKTIFGFPFVHCTSAASGQLYRSKIEDQAHCAIYLLEFYPQFVAQHFTR